MSNGIRIRRFLANRVRTGVRVAMRYATELGRPSKARNARRLLERGEQIGSLTIRGATFADVVPVARLHVQTYNETHVGPGDSGPTFEIREWQWREKLGPVSDWFTYVIEDPTGRLVGFAAGHPGDSREFGGRLNKIYLLREYQRLGLGRRLVQRIVERFLADGITSMMLFTEVENPACWFYDALGGERQVDDAGEFGGMYGWHDLHKLAALLADK